MTMILGKIQGINKYSVDWFCKKKRSEEITQVLWKQGMGGWFECHERNALVILVDTSVYISFFNGTKNQQTKLNNDSLLWIQQESANKSEELFVLLDPARTNKTTKQLFVFCRSSKNQQTQLNKYSFLWIHQESATLVHNYSLLRVQHESSGIIKSDSFVWIQQ